MGSGSRAALARGRLRLETAQPLCVIPTSTRLICLMDPSLKVYTDILWARTIRMGSGAKDELDRNRLTGYLTVSHSSP